MTNMKTKVERCPGGKQKGLNGNPPGESDRCPVCTARPKVGNDGLLKRHEQRGQRFMEPKKAE